ncbi:PREDICTED: late secretory pathway protein AVL9 homolog isoform X2 [Bactrocera latifrons]|uniref:late secretory pathway protein AVL9 homolog isoform X2 n=1 Tax=Bactrocera latifrons TaxID=174628 RepID=UPI0008DDE25F|nr:PREDICTED: late secretory pathway protein AVL9 homolog isoform X2 [Bactrocera latifrons]
MALSTAGENRPPILHILVVGFHHKLGCQVEFSYPPLIPNTTGKNECPSGWKYLPTLALPDGSHNFGEDTVFFNLPSLTEPAESVYGVSCYKQIPIEKLTIRTADMTRSTVQKSIVVLARLPIYGYIEVKLSLIADAFFEKGDFSCTELLIKAYQQLNACLLDDETQRPLRNFYVGLSLREIVLQWRHKVLILFKLFLLQRRVVCFGSPVRGMCVLVLGIASLIPRLLEKGFQEVACVRTSRPLSPMPDFTDSIHQETAELKQVEEVCESEGDNGGSAAGDTVDDCTLVSSAISAANQAATDDTSTNTSSSQSTRELNRLDSLEGAGDIGNKRFARSDSLTREGSVDTLASTLCTLCSINPDEYRAPISIFASGNLFLPYLSLPYMDLLSDPSVLSYVIGTSNVLFQQKRQLADVLVDIENANIDALDGEVRRQLILSTEDLRFMDYMLKHVQTPKEDAEGSEHWIRDQFQGYILALLRTAVSSDVTTKDNEHFNAHFMQAFKRTQCFQEWYDVRPVADFFDALPAGHPFAGTLSVADMKLKIAQTMQNSESGRKINQAVNTTSRVVGVALSQAKGTFSTWWSSITTPPTQAAAPAEVGDGESVKPCMEQQLTEQPQEISITFQKNIEDRVNIHIEGEKKMNCSGSNTSSSGSEKPIDSAEELGEDEVVLDNKNISGEADSQTDISGEQLQQGIVEIGREADVLNKPKAAPLQTPTCGTDVANETPRDNGDVFIV